MGFHPWQMSPMQKNIACTIGFFMPIIVFGIAIGVMNGTLPDWWITVASVLFYGTVLVMLLCVVSWMAQRFRGGARKVDESAPELPDQAVGQPHSVKKCQNAPPVD